MIDNLSEHIGRYLLFFCIHRFFDDGGVFSPTETWEAFFKNGNWDHLHLGWCFLCSSLALHTLLWVLMWNKWMMMDGMTGSFFDDCECIMAYIMWTSFYYLIWVGVFVYKG